MTDAHIAQTLIQQLEQYIESLEKRVEELEAIIGIHEASDLKLKALIQHYESKE